MLRRVLLAAAAAAAAMAGAEGAVVDRLARAVQAPLAPSSLAAGRARVGVLDAEDAAPEQALPGAVEVRLANDQRRNRNLHELFDVANSQTEMDRAIGVATESVRVLGEIDDPERDARRAARKAKAKAKAEAEKKEADEKAKKEAEKADDAGEDKAADKDVAKAAADARSGIAHALKAAAKDGAAAAGDGAGDAKAGAGGADAGDAAGKTEAKADANADADADAGDAKAATTASSGDGKNTTEPDQGLSHTSVAYDEFVKDKAAPHQGRQAQFPVPYETFEKFDADKNGQIDYREFRALLDQVSVPGVPSGRTEYKVTVDSGSSSGGPVWIQFTGPTGARTEEVQLSSSSVPVGRSEFSFTVRDVTFVSSVRVRRAESASGGLWNVTRLAVRAHEHLTASVFPQSVLRADEIVLVSDSFHLSDTAQQQSQGGDVADPWTRAHYQEYQKHLADFVDWMDRHLYEQRLHNLDAANVRVAAKKPSEEQEQEQAKAAPPAPAAKEAAKDQAAAEPVPVSQQAKEQAAGQAQEMELSGDDAKKTTTTTSTPEQQQQAEAAKAADAKAVAEKVAAQRAKEAEEDKEEAFKKFAEKKRLEEQALAQQTVADLVTKYKDKVAAAEQVADDERKLRKEEGAADTSADGGAGQVTRADMAKLDDLKRLLAEAEAKKAAGGTPAEAAEGKKPEEEEEEKEADKPEVNPLRGVPLQSDHEMVAPTKEETSSQLLARSQYVAWAGKLPPHMRADMSWDYNSPDNWQGFCTVGKRQSPVALSASAAVRSNGLEKSGDTALELHFRRAHFDKLSMKHTGNALVVQSYGLLGTVLSGSSKTEYRVDRVEFRDAEHRVAGADADVEMQIYAEKTHRANEGQQWLAISVRFKAAKYGDAGESVFLQDTCEFDKLPVEAGSGHALGGYFDLALASDWRSPYFSYEGSVTSPTCDEDVSWRVLSVPESMSSGQLHAWRRVRWLHDARPNARPPQPLNGRRVVLSA